MTVLIVESGRGADLLGGLVFKAHRLVYHSTLGLRVIKKKKNLRDDLSRVVDEHRAVENLVLTVLIVALTVLIWP